MGVVECMGGMICVMLELDGVMKVVVFEGIVVLLMLVGVVFMVCMGEVWCFGDGGIEKLMLMVCNVVVWMCGMVEVEY